MGKEGGIEGKKKKKKEIGCYEKGKRKKREGKVT